MPIMTRRPNRIGDSVPAAITEVCQIYAELAARPVERHCLRRTECCQFKLTGQTPYLTKGEALVAARALRTTGRKQLPVAINGACPMLEAASGHCLIYADRPFGCRTHFCAAISLSVLQRGHGMPPLMAPLAAAALPGADALANGVLQNLQAA